MRDDRGSWYLLTGLVLGLVFGLVYAWVISPQEYGDTSPAYLRSDFKDRYRAMIALAFAANGNLPRAQARLNLLGDSDTALAVAGQAQRARTDGSSPGEAQALELLGTALAEVGTSRSSTQVPTGNPASASETPPSPIFLDTPGDSPAGLPGVAGDESTVTPETAPSPLPGDQASGSAREESLAATPLPVRTPTPTDGSIFVLEESTFICDHELGQPLIQVFVQDGSGEPVPGVEVLVVWDGGEDHFFTGLKPELGPGYADFGMVPGVVYTLRLAAGGQPVPDLSAAECESENEERYWGSWSLVFSQP